MFPISLLEYSKIVKSKLKHKRKLDLKNFPSDSQLNIIKLCTQETLKQGFKVFFLSFYRNFSSNCVYTVLSTVFTQSIKYEKRSFKKLPRGNLGKIRISDYPF